MTTIELPTFTPEHVVRLIQSHRFDLSTEKHLQANLETALRNAGLPFEREKRLSQTDIPDFLINDCIVIECKLKGKNRKIDVFKQLSRYAAHQDVTAIVLASDMSIGLPHEIGGKPVYSASITRGWL